MVKMEGPKKRERSTNFSSMETDILMKRIFQEFQIIENKKTDSASLKEKNDAWKRVQTYFNSACGVCPRDINSIKTKYENIKRTLKKKAADLKLNNGGKLLLVWYEEHLLSKLQLGIQILPSVGDRGDQVDNGEGIVKSFNESQPITECEVEIKNEHDYLYTMPETDGVLEDVNVNCPSTSLCVSLNDEDSRKWNLRKRKRNSTTSYQEEPCNNLGQSTSQAELLDIRRQCYETELACKREEGRKKEEEINVRKNILELECKIKQAQLERELLENKHQEEIHNLKKEELKTKIKILKCELNNKMGFRRRQKCLQ